MWNIHDYREGIVVQEFSLKICFSRPLVLASVLFGCDILGADCVVLYCDLKLPTSSVASEASCQNQGQGEFWFRPRPASACVLFSVTYYELQVDLQIIVTCSGLGGAWDRLS